MLSLLKSENSPGCAVLMGSVASIIAAKIIGKVVQTKHINTNNAKAMFDLIF